MVEANPLMIQVCCKHVQHIEKLHDLGVLARLGVCVCSRQVRCSDQIRSVLARIICSDQIASYIKGKPIPQMYLEKACCDLSRIVLFVR